MHAGQDFQVACISSGINSIDIARYTTGESHSRNDSMFGLVDYKNSLWGRGIAGIALLDVYMMLDFTSRF